VICGESGIGCFSEYFGFSLPFIFCQSSLLICHYLWGVISLNM
jgi:hypothetical protein